MALRLMEHDTRWAQEFEQTKSNLLSATEGWIVEVVHIGSTALPDVVARPSVDVVAGMADLRGLNEAANLVEGLNFLRVPSPEWCEEELVAALQKPRANEPTHSVLLVKHRGIIWQQVLATKRLLLDSSELREALGEVKKTHYAAGCSAEEAYRVAKSNFFAALRPPQ